MKKIIIIEGKACSGKETIAKELAKEMKYTYINAGLIFRGTIYAIAKNIDLNQAQYIWKNGKSSFMLNEKDVTKEISTLFIGQSTSEVATSRKGFLLLAKNVKLFSEKYNNIIVDGIGMKSIFPKAQHQFYLYAPIKIRVKRRLKDLLKQKIETSYKLVYEDLVYRDKCDTERNFCPLRTNPNKIDTSKISVEETVNIIKQAIYNK